MYVQILDESQIAASSRLPECEVADILDVPDMLDEDGEEGTPLDYSAHGLLPQWDIFELHGQLLRALHHQSFTKPTPIQSKALPPALRGRDVVAVAETVRAYLHPLHSSTYISTGIGKNSGIWITGPAQTPLIEGTSNLDSS